MPGPNYAAMPSLIPEAVPAQKVVPEVQTPSPAHVGGGWYELSDGTRVQGQDDAVAAEAAL